MKMSELIKKVKPYFKSAEAEFDRSWLNISAIESCMQSKIGKEYEFAWVDGEIVGIGKFTNKGRKLILHRHEVEKCK